MRVTRPLLLRLGIVGGSRFSKTAWALLTVVALAFVIYGVAAVSAPKKDSRSASRSTSPEIQAQRLFGEALASEKRGDIERAVMLATSALELDAGNEAARQLLDRVKQGSSGSDSGPDDNESSDDGQEPVDPVDVDAGYTDVISPLTSLLPKSVKGYRLGAVDDAGKSVILPLEPDGAAGILSALMTVIDSGSVNGASAYVSGLEDAGYSFDRKEVRVGDMTAEYGRDSLRHATVVYSRGRYTFEVVATLVDAGRSGLDRDLATVAAAFPSAKL